MFQMMTMKVFLSLLAPLLLFGEHIFETKLDKMHKKAMNNPKVRCYTVCDKKLYRQQEIAKAISFYKNTKEYKFGKSGFSNLE